MGNRVELDEMGKRILDASRTDLYLSMRFLGPALHSLGFVMDLSTTTVGTDAAMIRFNPNYLFRLYVERPRRLNRTYLHMLLHCVFRHMFTARDKEDTELWDLACDIAVGSIIDSMEYSPVEELVPEYRQRIYEKLEAEIRVLTAEKIYQYFLEKKRNYLEELQMRAAFALCDHSFWERMEEEEPDSGRDEDAGGDSDPQGGADREDPDRQKTEDRNTAGQDGRKQGQGRPSDNARDGEDPSQSGEDRRSRDGHPDRNGEDRPGRDGQRDQDRNPLDDPRAKKTEQKVRNLKSIGDREREWKETSERMEAELLASGREASAERGSLERILTISNRRRTDYREFLKRFAVLREVAAIDPDSFDYGFYYYGLEFYGNMPLIEENEYREMNRIRTLVIAIDTSASCQEVLVQRFINETAAVLRSIGRFFHSGEVHIIECDEHVQHELVVHSPEELERYADRFEVKGGFGTDFRPVFSLVEEKRKKGEIRDLAGLMYFTDGMGIYPEKPTDYDTAFVFFNDEELDDSKVPDWAIRLYIGGGKPSLQKTFPNY